MQISGTFLEKQIILSLRVYQNRALYTREALKSLFMLCGQWTERQPDVIEVCRLYNYMQDLKLGFILSKKYIQDVGIKINLSVIYVACLNIKKRCK